MLSLWRRKEDEGLSSSEMVAKSMAGLQTDDLYLQRMWAAEIIGLQMDISNCICQSHDDPDTQGALREFKEEVETHYQRRLHFERKNHLFRGRSKNTYEGEETSSTSLTTRLWDLMPSMSSLNPWGQKKKEVKKESMVESSQAAEYEPSSSIGLSFEVKGQESEGRGVRDVEEVLYKQAKMKQV